ncbi:exonuclease domain-containing protein [Sphingomonas floccifaciens]|uniref:Exonuclease domain-containing protein n=1 Tax=Sphingomonas floccifaciens TaxID=1844115 RepID=A0ABW4N896_9SPHN
MFSSSDIDATLSSAAGRSEHETPDFVVVDVETSCSSVSSICQVGIVGFKDGVELFEYETLVNPLDRFSPFNIRIHGITGDHVVDAPTFADIHAIVDGHLGGRVTVAHSFFDKGALGAACRIHDRPAIETRWLDSVRVAKRAWPDLPSHRLNALTKYLGIRHRHHDALSDARAAGLVVVRASEHTGIDLAGWLAPTRMPGGSAPKPAPAGPLKGERVAILGAARDGALARHLAAAGARVVASVGTTTTMLVVSQDQPFGRFFTAHADYRKAEEMRRGGAAINILTEDEIRHRLAPLPAS